MAVRKIDGTWVDGDGVVLDVAASLAAANRQEAVSRRGQALLAAAGESEPCRRWYVLRVFTGQEKAVDNALAQARVERWLPVCEVDVRRRARVGGKRPAVKRAVPVWPGYLFVRVANTAPAWAGLAMIKGVLAVLGTAESPAPVSDLKILELKSNLEHDETARDILADVFKPGQKVRVTEGPFASFPGTVEAVTGFDRAKVEVMIFGRATLVDLELAQIAKCG